MSVGNGDRSAQFCFTGCHTILRTVSRCISRVCLQRFNYCINDCVAILVYRQIFPGVNVSIYCRYWCYGCVGYLVTIGIQFNGCSISSVGSLAILVIIIFPYLFSLD